MARILRRDRQLNETGHMQLIQRRPAQSGQEDTVQDAVGPGEDDDSGSDGD